MKKEHIKKMQEQSKVAYSATHEEGDTYRQSWRIFRIMAEFVEGYQFLQEMKKEVTILGSARFEEGDHYYTVARDMGRLLAKGGFTTITGGGPGVMEASNRGAFEEKGVSVGLNIQLPFEQVLNPFVTKFTSFNYFFTRKVMLTSPANAFIFLPGGFGTMDEFFEVVDLMNLGMLTRVPIVLIGSDYWNPILAFLRTSGELAGSLDAQDMAAWHVVDTAEEAYEKIKDTPVDAPMMCHLSPNSFHCEGDMNWKIFRVMAELVEGFEFLSGLKHDITVLGTKSISPESHYYRDAEALGRLLVEKKQYAVVTGGISGIAEAANKGAYQAGGVSIGLGMNLPGSTEHLNQYLTKSLTFQFPFTRKVIVTAPSEGFVFFPGGFGTLHHFFEVLTLMQTKKMKKRPIILYDRAFWQPLHELIKKHFVHDVETVSSEDDELYQIVDSVDSVLAILHDSHE